AGSINNQSCQQWRPARVKAHVLQGGATWRFVILCINNGELYLLENAVQANAGTRTARKSGNSTGRRGNIDEHRFIGKVFRLRCIEVTCQAGVAGDTPVIVNGW